MLPFFQNMYRRSPQADVPTLPTPRTAFGRRLRNATTEAEFRRLVGDRVILGLARRPNLCNLLMNYDLHCYVQDTGLPREVVERRFVSWAVWWECTAGVPVCPYTYADAPAERAAHFTECREHFSVIPGGVTWEQVRRALVEADSAPCAGFVWFRWLRPSREHSWRPETFCRRCLSTKRRGFRW